MRHLLDNGFISRSPDPDNHLDQDGSEHIIAIIE